MTEPPVLKKALAAEFASTEPTIESLRYSTPNATPSGPAGSSIAVPLIKHGRILGAMQFLNMIANRLFSALFKGIMRQRVTDTLCGTKVLRREEYERIAAGRSYFGEFDPFGDFDLIFGAARQNLALVDLPIRYRERTYGTTNIQRFRHGLILLRMVLFAARRIKFI